MEDLILSIGIDLTGDCRVAFVRRVRAQLHSKVGVVGREDLEIEQLVLDFLHSRKKFRRFFDTRSLTTAVGVPCVDECLTQRLQISRDVVVVVVHVLYHPDEALQSLDRVLDFHIAESLEAFRERRDASCGNLISKKVEVSDSDESFGRVQFGVAIIESGE